MTPRRDLNAVALLAAWFWGLTGAITVAAEDFTFHHENVMGTALELRVRAETEQDAQETEARVLGEIDRLSAIFSTYDPRSEFSRWQRTSTPTRVSRELFEVLQAADQWRVRSAGAFDPRVEALTRLWSDAARSDRRPSADQIVATRALMQPEAWSLDADTHTAHHRSACPLSLNAIAKGWILDRAAEAGLQPDRGIRGLLLNVGGDLRARGESLGPIRIASPRNPSDSSAPLATIDVRDRSVATSGNYRRGFRIQGHGYSHILDPRSGTPVDRTVSATVVARNGADADALATIFNVLAPEESLRLARSFPDVECLLVASDGRIARSAGWRRFETVGPLLATRIGDGGGEPVVSENNPGAAADGFEMLIRFEINGPSGNTRRYRRPYVAVWVEDAQGRSVRTLVLWVQRRGRSQWVRDLKRWYRSDLARLMADKADLKGTLSQATRSPGTYDVTWDGKDDHGQILGPGDYTVYLEAAREHGTYQIIKKMVTLGNQPFTEDLKGNVEIKGASLEYRRSGGTR